MNRNRLLAFFVLACLLTAPLAGCTPEPEFGQVGRPGTSDGEFREPRGVSVSAHGIAVLDKTGRLQLFALDGAWRRTVQIVSGNVRRGLPIGVSWLEDGTLAVAHTHENAVLLLNQDGTTARRFGEEGIAPGQFMMPQRVTPDRHGRLLVCDHGIAIHRVQLVEADGRFVRMIGGADDADGALRRPMCALELEDGRYLVADQTAGLVLYDEKGAFIGPFSDVKAPEDSIVQGMCRAATARDGTDPSARSGDIFVADLQRAEVRRYGADGRSKGSYGHRGIGPGEFAEPWDLAEYDGWLYVADKENHRVEKVRIDSVDWKRP